MANWNAERIEWLKELRARGLSAAQIAAEMGGDLSRSAVCGKLFRLGMTSGPRVRAARPPRPPRPPHPPRPARPRLRPSRLVVRLAAAPLRIVAGEPAPRRAPEPMPVEAVPFAQRCSLMELRDDTCRWPVGEPGTPGFFFCGGKAVDGLPYCGWHSRLAYQPLALRSGERTAR